jgi:hypothetical protein
MLIPTYIVNKVALYVKKGYSIFVIPAQAGIHSLRIPWIPYQVRNDRGKGVRGIVVIFL